MPVPRRKDGKLFVDASASVTYLPDMLHDVVYQPTELVRDAMVMYIQIRGSLAVYKVREDLVRLLRDLCPKVDTTVQKMLLEAQVPALLTQTWQASAMMTREPFIKYFHFMRRRRDHWHQSLKPKLLECDESTRSSLNKCLARVVSSYKTGVEILNGELSNLEERFAGFEKEGLVLNQINEKVSEAQEAMEEDFRHLCMSYMSYKMQRETGERLKLMIAQTCLRKVSANVQDLRGWLDIIMEQERQATELADGLNDTPMGGTGC